MAADPWSDSEVWARWLALELGIELEPWQQQFLARAFTRNETLMWKALGRQRGEVSAIADSAWEAARREIPPATCSCGRLLLWRLADDGDAATADLIGHDVDELVIAPCKCGVVHAMTLI